MYKSVVTLMLMVLGLSACVASTTHLSREDMLEQLVPMRDLEVRYEELQSSASAAAFLGMNPVNGELENLKNHLDLYWTHYYAAHVAIANEDLDNYSRHLEYSEFEMKAMESIVKKAIHDRKPSGIQLQQLPRLKF